MWCFAINKEWVSNFHVRLTRFKHVASLHASGCRVKNGRIELKVFKNVINILKSEVNLNIGVGADAHVTSKNKDGMTVILNENNLKVSIKWLTCSDSKKQRRCCKMVDNFCSELFVPLSKCSD
jgi:hypothetical protein